MKVESLSPQREIFMSSLIKVENEGKEKKWNKNAAGVARQQKCSLLKTQTLSSGEEGKWNEMPLLLNCIHWIQNFHPDTQKRIADIEI